MTMGRDSILWNTLLVLLGAAATFALLWTLVPRRIHRWVPPATPEALGAIRLWVAAILFTSVLWEDLPSSAYLPRDMLLRDLQWMIAILLELPIGFERFLADPQALRAFEGVTLVLLGCAMVGAGTRWTVPAAALCYVVLGSILRSYDHMFHQGIVPLFALALLAFTPCGDALSVDRWLRRRRGLPVVQARVPTLRHGLGRYLVWLAIALPYVMAGLSKVRNAGLWWWHGSHMRQMVFGIIAQPTHFGFQGWRPLAGAPDWVWSFMGLTSLLTELLFGLVLVSALARRVLPAIVVAMHFGILFVQNIFFPDLIAVQAVFYNWRRAAEHVRGWWRKPAGSTPRLAFAGAAAASVPADVHSRGTPPSLEERTGDPGGLSRGERRLAIVSAAFILISSINWAGRTEKFPFTAWQMFSGWNEPGPVEHVRPMVVYEDGTRERARFERWIWAVADGRYRWLLTGWDRRPERIAQLRQFLDACAALANRDAPPGRRVTAFEIEVWEWDYRRHPGGPENAELRRVLRHPVRPAAPPARELTRVGVPSRTGQRDPQQPPPPPS